LFIYVVICVYNAQMKLPPLENLRIFEAVARLRGFTAAAETLSLSHSAVSRRVSELEARLGQQLLVRTSRQVALTPAGKILFEAAQDALSRIEIATSKITQTTKKDALLISCERSLAMRWLIPRLSSFQDAHPAMAIYLSTGGGAIDLERENIDVAIRRADFNLDPRMLSVPLFPEYIGPVMSVKDAQQNSTLPQQESYLHTTGRPEAWAFWNDCLQGEKTPKTDASTPSPDSLRRTNSRSKKEHYFDHFFLSLQAAEAGLGCAIAPLFLVIDSLQSSRLVAPSGFIPDGTEYLALLRQPLAANSNQEQFMLWLQAMSDETLALAHPFISIRK
jgi:DNA-binding transcriptional LysR family regulator